MIVTYDLPDLFESSGHPTVLLEAVRADTSIPNRLASRRAIAVAINRAAAEHKGLVHVSWVRPHLPSWVTPQQVGAMFSGLHLDGHLRATGRYLPNGGPSGNAAKPAKVSRLVTPIDTEAIK